MSADRGHAIRTRGFDTRQLALPMLAFALTVVGLLLVVGGDDGAATPPVGVDTVVASVAVPAGTAAADLTSVVEIRVLDEGARAEGALGSLDELGDGVVNADLVPGQQLLASSFAEDVVDALGPDLVAVSVRLEAQRWIGPYRLTGDRVTVHRIGENGTEVLADEVRILDAPAADAVDPRSEQLISLAVPESAVGTIMNAAAANELWMAGR